MNAFKLAGAAIAMMTMASGVAMAQPANDEATLAAYMEEGAGVYTDFCSACHGVNGEGGAGPQLANNAFVSGRSAIINQVLYGATDHGMPPFAPVLTDEQVAAVTTYVRNSFGNEYGLVLPRSVELRRTAGEEAAQ